MKKSRTVYFAIGILASACLIWWLLVSKLSGFIGGPASGARSSGSIFREIAARFDQAVKRHQAFDRAVDLYGQVVDQNGDPVAGASIKIYPLEGPSPDHGRVLTQTADAGGRFHVTGLKAASVGIDASHPGYIPLSDLGPAKPASGRVIDYDSPSGTGPLHRNPATPAILTLIKPLPPEPLDKIVGRRTDLPGNGDPRWLEMDREHRIEVRCPSEWDQHPEGQRQKYSWRVELKLPEGGGFVERHGPEDFEAPSGGYQEAVVLDFPESLPTGKWHPDVERSYFVRFPDGLYARLDFSMGTGYAQFARWSSWLNPKAGSRTLTVLP